MNCIAFLKATASKIIERSPLKYKMVRMVSCLSPTAIIRSRSICQTTMGELTQYLYNKNHLSSLTADRCKVQFTTLCSKADGALKDIFSSYSVATERLDSFYARLLQHDPEFEDLWCTVKLVMILSHGNASVEGGFSINADMLVENLHEESLNAQRHVYDAVTAAGGLLQVKIDRRMMQFHRGAYSRYKSAQEVESCNIICTFYVKLVNVVLCLFE
jgi:hypothetical protein